MRIADIRPSDISAWRKGLTARLSNDTINSSHGTLRQVFAAAVQDGIISRNVAAEIKPLAKNKRKEIHPLTLDQVAALADEIDPRYRGLVLFAGLGSGMRAGELWALRVERISFLKPRQVHVVEAVSELSDGRLVTKAPKTREARWISLDEATVEILARHLERYSSPDGLVFTSPEGKQVRHGNFRDDHFLPAVARMGDQLPDGFRFHDLRHTHASLLFERGWQSEEVKDRLGHGSIRTTVDWYAHLFTGHDESRLQQLAAEITQKIPRPGRVLGDSLRVQEGPA